MPSDVALRVTAVSLFVLLAFTACGSEPALPTPDPGSTRTIDQGELTGFELDGAHVWRGIPFARSTAGEGRWRPPQPPEPWSGRFEAVAFGPVCPQLSFDEREPVGSEDCLQLNVHAPRFARHTVPTGDERLPVMVWIHGGGMSIGSSQYAIASLLAARHDVVVVAIQYRLGVLGWFSHPALEADAANALERSGNWGTLDQIRALEWVRDNVSAFGGDPARVTIFGQSAGGISVYGMLLSPLAKGLFSAAISHSGFPTTFSLEQARALDANANPGEGLSSAEYLLSLLQHEGVASDRQSAQARLAELGAAGTADSLRGRSPEALLDYFAKSSGAIGGIYITPFQIRDGTVLPADPPEQVFERGDYNRVPVVLGTNRDETRAYMSQRSPHVSRVGMVPLRFRDARRYDQVARYGSRLWKALGADEPATAILRHQHDVWVYRFDWDGVTGPPWIDFRRLFGAAHGVELPFLWGAPDYGYMPGSLFDVEEFDALSFPMQFYWTTFARDHDPGSAGGRLPVWKRWASPDPEFLAIDTRARGGLRMSGETVTRDGLVAQVAADPTIANDEERCEVYQAFVQWSDTFTLEEYAGLLDGGCAAYPLRSRTVFE